MAKSMYMVVEYFKNKDAIGGFAIMGVWHLRACCTYRVGSMTNLSGAIS